MLCIFLDLVNVLKHKKVTFKCFSSLFIRVKTEGFLMHYQTVLLTGFFLQLTIQQGL